MRLLFMHFIGDNAVGDRDAVGDRALQSENSTSFFK